MREKQFRHQQMALTNEHIPGRLGYYEADLRKNRLGTVLPLMAWKSGCMGHVYGGLAVGASGVQELIYSSMSDFTCWYQQQHQLCGAVQGQVMLSLDYTSPQLLCLHPLIELVI